MAARKKRASSRSKGPQVGKGARAVLDYIHTGKRSKRLVTRGGGRKCWLCVNDEASEAVTAFFKLKRAGKTGKTWGEFTFWLRNEYGYPNGEDAVAKHLRMHLSDIYYADTQEA